jgi:hypothetical protein
MTLSFGETTPEQICKFALIARGAPQQQVLALPPGRKLDYLVHIWVAQRGYLNRLWSDVVSEAERLALRETH